MYCETHPKYTGYRRPSGYCHSCWRVYSEVKNKNLHKYAEDIASKNPDISDWLIDNFREIDSAPVVREASVESALEFVVLDDELIEEFKILPEETEQRIPVSGHPDPLFYVAKKVVDEESEKDEDEEVSEPQRGRFV